VVAGEDENFRATELGFKRAPDHSDLLGKIFEAAERSDRLGLTSKARLKLLSKRVAQSGPVAIYTHAPM
jgi:hypothetical protein